MKIQPWLILLDLDDTLMPTNYRYHECTLRAGLVIQKALRFKSARPHQMISLQKEIDSELFAEMAFQVDRFPQSWAMTYERLCKRAGVQVSDAVRKRVFNTAARFKYGPFKAFRGAKSALCKLHRAGHKLHCVTAGELDLQRRKIEQAGLMEYFDEGRLSVCLVDKVEAFRKLSEETDSPVMMVGDSKRNDIGPAQDLGLVTVWVPSETRHDGDIKVEPDYQIEHIRELPDLVRKLAKKKTGGKKKSASGS